MGEEKSFSQRAFSIYTDIRKLQDKAKTSYTLSTRRLRFGYEQQFSRSTPGAFIRKNGHILRGGERMQGKGLFLNYKKNRRLMQYFFKIRELV